MNADRFRRGLALMLLAGLVTAPKWMEGSQQQDVRNDRILPIHQTQSAGPSAQAGRRGDSGNLSAAQIPAVPTDLKPLLAPKPSEMRLVTQRYTADRTTLDGNYDGGGRRGAGRGDGAGNAPTPPLSLSSGRIARLKRNDLDWQAALARLDPSRLSSDARTDLENLESTIQARRRRIGNSCTVGI
jgi:hypothetical protein